MERADRAETQRGKEALISWTELCGVNGLSSVFLSGSAGEKHLVAFTGCSSLAGEEQKKYRAEGLSEWKEQTGQRRRGGKKP